MKILFSVGNCEKKLHVTTKLIYAISKQLAVSGHKCYIVGYSHIENDHYKYCNGVELIQFTRMAPLGKLNSWYLDATENAYNDFLRWSKTTNNHKANKIQYALRKPIKALILKMNVINPLKEEFFQKDYGKKIKKVADRIQPDAIICLQDPIWAVRDTLTYIKDLSCKKAIYQVDPWGLFDQDKVIGHPRKVADELEALNQVDYLFSTVALYSQQKNHPSYHKYLEIIKPVEFPNVEKKEATEVSAFDFDQACINILFCGSIQGEYRNPEKFLDILCQLLSKNPNIKCYFMGAIDQRYLQKCLLHYPNNFFVHEEVSPAKAYATMMKADFLLNFGNNYTNMVPSKIFDYFSIGKPIINVQKIEKCPARTYFDKYPLSFTINEWKQENIEKELYDFLQYNAGKQLDYNDVEELFYECTPEYVSEVFLETLKGNKHE